MVRSGSVLIAAFSSMPSLADVPNVTDTNISRSTNGGLTWSAPTIVAAHTGGNTPSTAAGRSDSCLAVNGSTGRVFLHYIYSPVGIGLSNSDNTTANGSTTTLNSVFRYSDDQGVTWSSEINITSSVKTSAMYGTSISSGSGWYDGAGTVSFPYCYTDSGGLRHDFVMSSSDNGTTWTRSAIINTNGDEHHVVQKSDGTWLCDARPVGTASLQRQLYSCATLGGTWTGPASSTMPDPGCNGSIVRVSTDPESPYLTWMLASGCASTATRSNLTVWLSKDNGATWPKSAVIYPGAAAYSGTVVLADGTFGILWEDNDHGCLQFTKLTLATLAY